MRRRERRRSSSAPRRRIPPATRYFDAIEHSGIPADEVGYFVLGTTVGVNALLQRKGARVLYVTTSGFEDVPFLQRVDRKFHYDLDWERPEPLVTRRDCLGVAERLDYMGAVVDPLTPEALGSLGDMLRARLDERTNGAVAVAVNCLFSYVKPDHERMIREYLARANSPSCPSRCRTRSRRSGGSTTGPARPLRTPISGPCCRASSTRWTKGLRRGGTPGRGR